MQQSRSKMLEQDKLNNSIGIPAVKQWDRGQNDNFAMNESMYQQYTHPNTTMLTHTPWILSLT